MVDIERAKNRWIIPFANWVIYICVYVSKCVYANTEEINNQYYTELFLFKLSP